MFEHSGHSDWQIWQDFVYMTSAALAQPVDFRQEREDEYLRIIGKYSAEEQSRFQQMLSEIVEAFEQEKFADILGELYMQLNMGNKWRGQFFTPYHICHMMAKMAVGNAQDVIDKKGYFSISDPCCGGGAMLIAFAQSCKEQNVNYQRSVLFTAQDIDPVVARMCFIQMALLGMPGSVIIGNSLTMDYENYDYWHTPMYFTDVWVQRRLCNAVMGLLCTEAPEESLEGETSMEVVPDVVFDESTKQATYQQLGMFELNPEEIDELDG